MLIKKCIHFLNTPTLRFDNKTMIDDKCIVFLTRLNYLTLIRTMK